MWMTILLKSNSSSRLNVITFKMVIFTFTLKIEWFILHHHHHHSSSEDCSGCFLFLDTKKCFYFTCIYFTAYFLISVASSAFSSGKRWGDICCRYVVDQEPGRRDYHTFDSKTIKWLTDSSLNLRFVTWSQYC